MRNQIIASITLASLTLAPGVALAADPPPPPPVHEVAEATPPPEGPEAPPQMTQEERQRRADADRASDRLLVGSYALGGTGLFMMLSGGSFLAAGQFSDSPGFTRTGVGFLIVGAGLTAGGIAVLTKGIHKRREAHGLAVTPTFNRRGGGASLSFRL